MTRTVARTVAAATAGVAVVFATMFGVGRLVPPLAPAPEVPQQAPAVPSGHEMPSGTGHQG